MELKNRKGFIHTLEAVIAASLLITTASVVVPEIQPENNIKDNTQQNIFQGLQTLDKTGDLRKDLSTNALEDEIKFLNPNEFNLTVLVSDTTTETIKLEVDEIPWRYQDRVNISEYDDWKGDLNQTSIDRADNSGNLGIGYLNGSKSGQSQETNLNNGNLVGFWRLDSSTDPLPSDRFNVTDYSGYKNNGSSLKGVKRGHQGIFTTNSFNFDEQGSYVNISDSDSLDSAFGGNKITISLWMKADKVGNYGDNYIGIVSKEPDGSDPDSAGTIQLHDADTSSPNLEFALGDGTSWQKNTVNDFVFNKDWMHIAGTYDGSKQSLYKNGKLLDQKTASFTIAENDYPLTIGRFPAFNNQFNGSVDELRIYNRSLSQDEIRALYFSGQNDDFKGNYSDSYDLNTNDVPGKIQVNSSNIDSGNVSWAKLETSEGESNEFKLDSGISDRNYSLGFSQAASEVDIRFNFSADNSTPINTPVIKGFKIWVNDTSDKNIEFDKEGDSVKTQIFVDESNGLNISLNSDLIAENITESKYIFQQTSNSGALSFSGDANLTVDITNKTIRGDAADEDDVKNVNYPIYENGSKEVTVSTWN